ncbi:MAG: BMC domain-containing protein [Acidobacteria bacterium]|nr:BMC domain-containing protein [Acidobacteriota bacterium]
MEREALGLIETVGLIGAIEAADAAAKAAAVRVVKSEVTQAALVTIHIEGELGAVQAAVEAGVAACRRVGELKTFVVIPRPDRSLDRILGTPSDPGAGPKPRRTSARTVGSHGPATKPTARPRSEPSSSTPPTGGLPGGSRLYATMTVAGLRRLARRRGDLPISGREVARADKEQLVRLLIAADARRSGDRE